MGWTVSEAHSASLGHYGATNMHAFLCRVCGVLCACVRVVVVVRYVIVLRDWAAFTCVRTYVCVCMYVCMRVCARILSISLSLSRSVSRCLLFTFACLRVRPSVGDRVCFCSTIIIIIYF